MSRAEGRTGSIHRPYYNVKRLQSLVSHPDPVVARSHVNSALPGCGRDIIPNSTLIQLYKTLHLTRMTLDDYSQSDTVCCNSAYIKVPVNAINIDSLSVWGTYTSTRTAVVHPDYYNLTDHEMFDNPSKGVVGQQLLSSIQE